MMATCPTGYGYGSIPTGNNLFSIPAQISTKYPSVPNAMQGQFFSNCPCISALASLAWVNRQFIANNVTPNTTTNPATGAVTTNSYSIIFCDYGVNNSVQLPNNTALGTPITVTVSPQVILAGGAMSNNNGPYGAGSSNANEIWPAIYERAYAKFLMYEYGLTRQGAAAPMSAANLTDITQDPSFTDLWNLGNGPLRNYWGGNGAYALMYLTGLQCFTLNTSATSFPTSTTGGVTGNIGTAANAASSATAAASAIASGTPLASMSGLYAYIESGLCSEVTKVYGMYKTRYPVTATTYAQAALSPNPGAVTYSNSTIVAGHNYSVLGVFDAPNGLHYIILRTTFGSNINYPNPTFGSVASGQWSAPPNGTGLAPYDAEFLMQGGVVSGPQYPTSNRAPKLPMTFNFSPTTPNGIFALEQGAFINYFQSIGWAQGY
jgi:hypothetical protein